MASASLGTGGTNGTGVGVGVGGGSGPLVSTSQDGGTTNANVNLGLGGLGLGGANDALNGVTSPVGTTLDGVNVGDLGGLGGDLGGLGGLGGGTLATTQVAASFGAMSASDQIRLRTRCGAVLSQPGSYDGALVTLCKMIATMH